MRSGLAQRLPAAGPKSSTQTTSCRLFAAPSTAPVCRKDSENNNPLGSKDLVPTRVKLELEHGDTGY